MLNPFAVYDCLSTTRHFDDHFGDVTVGELHIFCYLACLLSLYRGNSASEWGYLFASTREGAPYSRDIEDAVSYLLRSGSLSVIDDGHLQLTDKGLTQYTLLRSLLQNSAREVFLDGACSSTLSLPVGTVREAVFSEPELRNAKELSSNRLLLDGPSTRVLYSQFVTLSQVLGNDIQDMMVPAVIWLRYLSQKRELTSEEFA